MKKQELINSLMNKMSHPNSNINPINNDNSINKGNNSSYLNQNSFHRKENNNNNKRPMTSKLPLPSYNNQDHIIPSSTKEKIKDLFCQIDEPKRMMSNKENIRLIPNPNLNPHPNTNNTNTLNHIKHYNSNSISRLGADKKKDYNSIEAFSDFTYKSPIDNREKNKTTSIINIDTLNNNNNNQSKSEYPIKANDIRSITNKIRFLSSDEAKGLDRNVIDELSNLRQVLNKLFDSKLKGKEYKFS